MIYYESKEEAERRADRMTVAEAAELMGCSAQYIRIGIQRGVFPFGFADHFRGNTRFSYYISRKKFTEFTGIEIPERIRDRARDGDGDDDEQGKNSSEDFGEEEAL